MNANRNRLKIMQDSIALRRANQVLANPNLDGNMLNTSLSGFEKMTNLTPEQEQLTDEIMARYRNRLLANTKAAEQQELAKQTTFAGGGLQMQAERQTFANGGLQMRAGRRRLLGV
jgi:hypothetical protein